MGKNGKKRGPDIDYDEMTGEDNYASGSTSHSNSNGPRRGSGDANGKVNHSDSRNNSGEDGGVAGAQTELDFGPYPDAVDDLLSAIHKVKPLFTRHRRDIRDATQTRQKLEEVTERCNRYRTTI